MFQWKANTAVLEVPGQEPPLDVVETDSLVPLMTPMERLGVPGVSIL